MPFPSFKKMTRPGRGESFILLMTSLLHSFVLPIITSHFVQNLRVPVDLLKGTLFLSQSYYIDQIFLTQQEAYSSFPTKAILRSYCARVIFRRFLLYNCTIVVVQQSPVTTPHCHSISDLQVLLRLVKKTVYSIHKGKSLRLNKNSMIFIYTPKQLKVSGDIHTLSL